MDKKTNQKINDFVSLIQEQNPQILKAFLFGSYAKRLNKPNSDIDIAIMVKDINDDEIFDLQVQLLLIASGFDSRIEPHIISNKDLETGNPFIAEILKTGIEIVPQTTRHAPGMK